MASLRLLAPEANMLIAMILDFWLNCSRQVSTRFLSGVIWYPNGLIGVIM